MERTPDGSAIRRNPESPSPARATRRVLTTPSSGGPPGGRRRAAISLGKLAVGMGAAVRCLSDDDLTFALH